MPDERSKAHPPVGDVDASLIRSCVLANRDPEVAAIEEEWDKLDDPIAEPWNSEQPGLSQ